MTEPQATERAPFTPDLLLPVQAYAPRGPSLPLKRLMVALIEDAVSCLCRYRYARTRHERRLFREAEQWLMSSDGDWPFSFENSCVVLGLDPSALRRGIMAGSSR